MNFPFTAYEYPVCQLKSSFFQNSYSQKLKQELMVALLQGSISYMKKIERPEKLPEICQNLCKFVKVFILKHFEKT